MLQLYFPTYISGYLKTCTDFFFQFNNYDCLIARTRFHAAIAVAMLSYYVDVYSISPYTSIVLHVFWYINVSSLYYSAVGTVQQVRWAEA